MPEGVEMTALMQGAVAAHELLMAHVEAGFTREEAMQILIAVMTATVREQG
jgi:hypothetical protein